MRREPEPAGDTIPTWPRRLGWILGGLLTGIVLWVLWRALGLYGFRSVPYLIVAIFVVVALYLERAGFRHDARSLIERRRRRRARAHARGEAPLARVPGDAASDAACRDAPRRGRRRTAVPQLPWGVRVLLFLVLLVLGFGLIPTCITYLQG